MIEVRKTSVFERWLAGLRDGRVRARIQARIDRLALGNADDVKPVGKGISELRINYGPAIESISCSVAGTSLFYLLAETNVPKHEILQRCVISQGFSKEIIMATKAKTKQRIKTTRWDTADYLKSDEDIAYYLEAVFEDGNPALIAHALGVVARLKGMRHVAAASGLGRESLYKALSADGNPEFATVLKVIQALGLKLKVAA